MSAEHGAPPFPGFYQPGKADGDQMMWYLMWGGEAGKAAIVRELGGREGVFFPWSQPTQPPVPAKLRRPSAPGIHRVNCQDLIAKLRSKRRIYGRDEISVCLAILKRTGLFKSAVDVIRTVRGYENVSKGMLSRWRKHRMNTPVCKTPGRRVNVPFETAVRDKLVFTIKVKVPVSTDGPSASSASSASVVGPASVVAGPLSAGPQAGMQGGSQAESQAGSGPSLTSSGADVAPGPPAGSTYASPGLVGWPGCEGGVAPVEGEGGAGGQCLPSMELVEAAAMEKGNVDAVQVHPPTCAVLCRAVLRCAALYCTVLYCTVLCCTALCCAVMRCAVLLRVPLCYAGLGCAVVCCAVPCCTALCFTVLYCAMLCFTVLCCVETIPLNVAVSSGQAKIRTTGSIKRKSLPLSLPQKPQT